MSRKAYLQGEKPPRDILYKPPSESFALYPQHRGKPFKASVLFYGEVEAGLGWYRTFIPWLQSNMLDYKLSSIDPALLVSPAHNAANAVCTDDTLAAIPKDFAHEEEKMAKRFKCRDSITSRFEFKGIFITFDENNSTVVLSQQDYVSRLKVPDPFCPGRSPNETLSESELSIVFSNAGILSWLAMGTCPTLAFQASIALQGSRPMKVGQLQSVIRALRNAIQSVPASLTYEPLDPGSIHI